MINRKYLIKNLFICSILLLIFLIMGVIFADTVKQSIKIPNTVNTSGNTMYYFYHNLEFLLIALSGIILLSIPTIAVLLINGFIFGVAIGISINNGMSIVELLLRLSHGIFEIPSLLLASSIGFFGLKFYNTKDKKNLIKFSLKVFILSIILLLIAAFWEANITNKLACIVK